VNPARWIAAVPLLLIPCSWLWWWAGGLNPGLETGRSADLLLLVLAATAAWQLRREVQLPTAALPLLLALAWQAVALAWAPVREPGLVWLIERSAACAAALGLAVWTTGRPTTRAAAIAGLGILALTCLTQYGDIGMWLRTNREAPFGNVNFDVGAALPLAAIGLTLFLHGGGRGWWLFALATGACAGLLAGGILGGDPCRAVWLGGGVAIAASLVLRLPRRAHAPLLIGGAALLLAGWFAAIAGVFDPGSLGAGSAQRVHLWRSAGEALLGPAALLGHGPGSVIAVLPEQPSFAAVWLTVPSYAAHAHAEPLQVLLDGGLILAGLLTWAVVLTLRPLWRRRDEPAIAALLVAWCVFGALALVESHLSQPGGLLCLAILAGLTWSSAANTMTLPAARLRVAVPALAAIALCLLIVRELAGDGGGPVSIETRAMARLDGDPTHDLVELDRLRERLGPLDNLDLLRARLLGRLGRNDEAEHALVEQLGRVPNAEAVHLAARLHQAGQAGPSLLAAEARALVRIRALLAIVRRNPRNGDQLDALAALLNPPASGDPAPAP
jgi:hypothetical protein